MRNFKTKIISALYVLANNEIVNGAPYKARAYKRVADQIRAIPYVRTWDDLVTVQGIGDSIRAKIDKLFDSATVVAPDDFTKVFGIGPVKANQLVATYGVRTIDELRVRQDELLNDKQKVGLKYYNDLLMRIPRKEMVLHVQIIASYAAAIDQRITSTIVGSYRRGMHSSGDIDVLICIPHVSTTHASTLFRKLCESMIQRSYITDVLAFGSKKFMGIAKLGGKTTRARRIDMLLSAPDEFPFALLYFTGSDAFNIAMRQHAAARGYTLNEHGLKTKAQNVPKPPKMKEEKDIFTFLEYPYVSPENRNTYE